MAGTNHKIFGYGWSDIQAMQQKCGSVHRSISPVAPGQDYGADPIGDGTFRMIPSGDIVDLDERNRRLRP